MIQDYIKKIIENVVSLENYGINDLTWEKKDATALLTSLMTDDIGILGGSVYKIEGERLIPMYDNWSCEPNEKETRCEYYLRSKTKALDYIGKYPVYPGEKIIFSLACTENVS